MSCRADRRLNHREDAKDTDGYFINRAEPVPDVPSWTLFAPMLLAARVYA
ncbi:DUF7660 family protein [Paenarthrobacter sp. 2TAF44]